jgi:uncharacterized protein YbjT (DUF2867 family)
MAHVFVSGSTGFVGIRAIQKLLERGHTVSALARELSVARVPKGARAVLGDPLQASTFQHQIAHADTFLHLTGITKPAPWKERQFRAVDLVSLRGSVSAASAAGIRHFVYVSVAQPAPVMKAYIKVRQECEQCIASSMIPASILRPWYVLGPGRQWPLLLTPFFRLMELAGSETARRLGLVTIEEMTTAIVWSVENPGARIIDVPQIRQRGRLLA